MSYDFASKVQPHIPVGDAMDNSLSVGVPVNLQQPVQEISISAFPSDTVYRCAHCSFAHNNQSEVVAHAKSCQSVAHLSAQSLSFTVGGIAGEEADYVSPASPDSEPERRGRGLPLWSDKKTKILLDGISQHVHIFSEDIRKIRRAWKLITRYTKDHAHFEVTSKQCAYKWNKLLTEYQTYMADTSSARPAFLDQVHDIVSQNKKILNKPDIYSFIKTISKLPSVPSNSSAEEGPSLVVHERLSGDELDLFSGEVSAEVLQDSALEASLEDCAQIHINEEGYEPAPSQPTPATRPARLWTDDRVMRLLKVITRYRELLARHAPVMVKYAWAVIAEETSKLCNFSVTGAQCNHKWRSLVAHYNSSYKLAADMSDMPPAIANRVRALHRAITSAQAQDKQDDDSDRATDQGDTSAGEDEAADEDRGDGGIDDEQGNLTDEDRTQELNWTVDDQPQEEEQASDDDDVDHKGRDPELKRAVDAEAARRWRNSQDSRPGRGGLRMLFWTDDRLQVLVDTIYDHCYLLDCPGNRTAATWKCIAAAVTKRGRFHVDYNRCLRKFRMLVKALLVNDQRWPEPPYFPGLWRIVRRLPPDCKSLPQKVMTTVIKTIQYVDCATEQKVDEKVGLNNGSRKDDSQELAQEDDDSSNEEEQEIGPRENNKTSNKNGRLPKVAFLKRKPDTEDCLEEGESGGAKNKRRKRAGGSDAENGEPPQSGTAKRRRSDCECSSAIARLEYAMTVQNNRMKSTLDTLVASVGAIDARLLATSSSVSNFFTGFLKSFNKLVDARVAETLRQKHHRPPGGGHGSNSD